MANRTAARLVLRDGDRARLERMTRSATGAAAAAQRARIVLLAADGVAKCVIAERCIESATVFSLTLKPSSSRQGLVARLAADGPVARKRGAVNEFVLQSSEE